ncbi:MAG: acyl carrier protein [Lachnospiraceae bacterium]|nr:acyl carrier protein [Lachnospiraceae bacterium]
MKEKISEYIYSIAESKCIKIENDSNLFDEGVLDSLGIIMLLSFLQEEFAIEFNFDDLDYNNYKSIDDVCNWVNKTNY